MKKFSKFQQNALKRDDLRSVKGGQLILTVFTCNGEITEESHVPLPGETYNVVELCEEPPRGISGYKR